jgi:hypothetical protein
VRAGGALWDFVDGEIKYFTDNQNRMRYDLYRAAKLPIGNGTIESACKNVIAGRMKQGGMTWSAAGVNGMLQIRSSIASGRYLQDFITTLGLVSLKLTYIESAPQVGQVSAMLIPDGPGELQNQRD